MSQIRTSGDEADLPVRAMELFDAAAVAASLCTRDGHIEHSNAAWDELFERCSGVVATSLGELLGGETDGLLATETASGGSERELLTDDGSRLDVRVHVRRLPEGGLRHVQIENLTALTTKIESLERLAHEDVLTGLLNRRGFLAEADRLSAIARREHRSLALLFVDVDGLKRINDDHGHPTGDAIIVDAARLLQLVFRSADAVGRYGGDEFCVLALTNGPASAEHLERRLLDAVSEHHTGNPDIDLRLTAGAVSIDDLGTETVADAIVRADRLMYAKRAVLPDW